MDLQQYLDDKHVWYERLHHEPTYTAQRTAQVMHVSGRAVAKSVLLRADDGYVLALLPASRHIEWTRMQAMTGAAHVELASELECREHFGDCEMGAIPPFGSRYGLRTFVDESLTEEPVIIFEGNNLEEGIRMRYADFARLEGPIVASFAVEG